MIEAADGPRASVGIRDAIDLATGLDIFRYRLLNLVSLVEFSKSFLLFHVSVDVVLVVHFELLDEVCSVVFDFFAHSGLQSAGPLPIFPSSDPSLDGSCGPGTSLIHLHLLARSFLLDVDDTWRSLDSRTFVLLLWPVDDDSFLVCLFDWLHIV